MPSSKREFMDPNQEPSQVLNLNPSPYVMVAIFLEMLTVHEWSITLEAPSMNNF